MVSCESRDGVGVCEPWHPGAREGGGQSQGGGEARLWEEQGDRWGEGGNWLLVATMCGI